MNAFIPPPSPASAPVVFSGYPYCPPPGISTEATVYVRDYLRSNDLYVDANGSVKRRFGDLTGDGQISIAEVLLQKRVDAASTLRDIRLYAVSTFSSLKKADLAMGFTAVLDDDAWIRRAQILEPLYAPLTPDELARANVELVDLCEACFDMDLKIAVAIIRKLIHMTKRKAANLPIENHIMAIIEGMEQGKGKTTLARKFLSVLCELASGTTNLSSLVDDRITGLFNRPVNFIDDMEMLAQNMVERLKAVISADTLERRVMYGQGMVEFRQDTVVVATCNRPAAELIRDPSGMRRFPSLRFRSSADVRTWAVINATNWLLIWRSVDVNDMDPIKPFRGALATLHSAQTPGGLVRAWVGSLDLKHDDVKGLRGPSGFKAGALRDLYVVQYPSRAEPTPRQFCAIVDECITAGVGPFRDKALRGNVTHYRDTEMVR